jgi:hypothetical protein
LIGNYNLCHIQIFSKFTAFYSLIMGCGPSKAELKDLAPRPARPGTNDTQLDRKALVAALRSVATFLARKKAKVTLIAVGGAVNTILL